MKNNPEPKIVINWRPVRGEPSPSFRRLLAKLFAPREATQAGTGEATGNGECNDEQKRDTQKL